MKKLTDYFSSWEGWYCEVSDEDGICCGEVIGCSPKMLWEHLKSKHNIEVELK